MICLGIATKTHFHKEESQGASPVKNAKALCAFVDNFVDIAHQFDLYRQS